YKYYIALVVMIAIVMRVLIVAWDSRSRCDNRPCVS
ncbi:MAG: hypothetical protein ACI8R1_000908, partial [Psychrobacter glaciei]